jgi:hypothetical protein
MEVHDVSIALVQGSAHDVPQGLFIATSVHGFLEVGGIFWILPKTVACFLDSRRVNTNYQFN